MIAETLAKLDSEEIETPFAPYEEEAVVSLALDYPEFFSAAIRFLQPAMFKRLETQFVIATLLNNYEKYETIPTREILRTQIEGQITEDDPFEEVFKIVNRRSNPREVPMIKDTLLKWTRHKAFSLLYSEEAQEAFSTGNYAYLEHVIASATKFADVGENCFWMFKELDKLFLDNILDHRSTGFAKLDKLLNDGGPSPGEVVCWMAATNVGKSILLVNNAISSLQYSNPPLFTGQNVLLVTFELDQIKTAMRCLGSATAVGMSDIRAHEDYITRTMRSMYNTYRKEICIKELPPDECSVDHIYSVIDNLKRTKGWRPDVLILDYLELMVSRHNQYNKDDYTRQKHVATEVRGLARNEKVLVFTATQTNRSGSTDEEGEIDLDKAAESFGKTMPLDYVISINQSKSERQATPTRLRLFIAKNRNGPKHNVIDCTINYNNMQVREQM